MIENNEEKETPAAKLEIKDPPSDNKDLIQNNQNPDVIRVAPLSRKKSSYVDIEKAKEEAKELLDPHRANDASKNKLKFEEKKISIFLL